MGMSVALNRDIDMEKEIFSDRCSIGSWITLGHPAVAEIMADAGFDWLAVDLEHSVITIREAEDLIRVIDLKGVIPLVRLSSNNEVQIKRVMDAGAHGVIVPMVNSEREAQEAVNAVKYPPIGKRGLASGRGSSYGIPQSVKEHVDHSNKETLVAIQIETTEAISFRR